MASFSHDAGSFEFTGDGSNYQESREARIGVQEIPGGDTFYADAAGRSPMHINIGMVLLNNSVFGAAMAAVGHYGSLAVESRDSHSCLLLKVSAPIPAADGQVNATAEFLVTDS